VTCEVLCARCGECAAACPTAAITIDEVVTTDAAACIWCCACVKVCPTGARVMEDPHIQRLATWLTTEHRARKEPEVYV
jgi:ferredoxin